MWDTWKQLCSLLVLINPLVEKMKGKVKQYFLVCGFCKLQLPACSDIRTSLTLLDRTEHDRMKIQPQKCGLFIMILMGVVIATCIVTQWPWQTRLCRIAHFLSFFSPPLPAPPPPPPLPSSFSSGFFSQSSAIASLASQHDKCCIQNSHHVVRKFSVDGSFELNFKVK